MNRRCIPDCITWPFATKRRRSVSGPRGSRGRMAWLRTRPSSCAVHLLEEPRLGRKATLRGRGSSHSIPWPSISSSSGLLWTGGPGRLGLWPNCAAIRELARSVPFGRRRMRAEDAFDSGAELARELRGIDEAQGPDPPAAVPCGLGGRNARSSAMQRTIRGTAAEDAPLRPRSARACSARSFKRGSAGEVE